MRVVVVVLFVALSGSAALAEQAKPKVPLRLVKVLPETQQALLFDKTKGSHVLAEVGEVVEGFTVDDIDDDEVTLISASGAQIVLAAPAPRWIGRPEVKPGSGLRTTGSGQSSDGKADPQPVDPYADAPIRSVEAPSDAPVRVVEAPAPVTDAAVAPVAPAAPVPPAAPVAAPVAPAAPVAGAVPDPAEARSPKPEVPSLVTISRPEFRASLGDFTKLAAAFHGTFTADGIRVDALGEGSLFTRVGLRAGDVIRAVDNQPLRSLDDAADLYARAGTARNITIQVVRGGKPLTLRVLIQ